MILAIDAGNTRIKWGVFENKWLAQGEIAHDQIATLSEVCKDYKPQQAVISNVAGNEIKQALQQHLQLGTLWVNASKQSCGVTNSYQTPEQLGSDRWAALIACWQLKKAACVVVSVGTAVTIDALSSNAEFLGGLIVPGLRLMQTTLAVNTAKLALLEGTHQTFPQNTGDAIYSGSLQAIAGAVLQMHSDLKNREKTAPLLLLTGGDALQLQPLLADKGAKVVENLVLDGLIHLHKEQRA